MKLEAGKYYWTRSGMEAYVGAIAPTGFSEGAGILEEVVGWVRVTHASKWSPMHWYVDGNAHQYHGSAYDLMAAIEALSTDGLEGLNRILASEEAVVQDAQWQWIEAPAAPKCNGITMFKGLYDDDEALNELIPSSAQWQGLKAAPKCECGAHAVRSKIHSSWCPLHEDL